MTNVRLLAWVGASLAALLLLAVLFAFFVDRSPLARLPGNLAVARDVSYGSSPHQVMDIVHPRSAPRARPAIVMIHPGNWMQGDKSSYHGMMAEYSRSGYVTASLNFRPSTEAEYPAAISDCKQAVRWLRAHSKAYGIDPSRIGVVGGSSGAHLALLLALSDDADMKSPEWPGESARVQAAVGVSGVYDFLMERKGRFPNREDDEAVVRFLGVPPRRNPERARAASPLAYLSRDDPPLLVFHGELDRRIDAEQARQLASALKAMGRPDEVVLLEGLGHGSGVLPDSPESLKRIREFFARHLRPDR